MGIVLLGEGENARPKVTAVEHPLLVDCTHRGCTSVAHYNVETREGHLIPRCWPHLQEDFGIDRLNPVNP